MDIPYGMVFVVHKVKPAGYILWHQMDRHAAGPLSPASEQLAVFAATHEEMKEKLLSLMVRTKLTT